MKYIQKVIAALVAVSSMTAAVAYAQAPSSGDACPADVVDLEACLEEWEDEYGEEFAEQQAELANTEAEVALEADLDQSNEDGLTAEVAAENTVSEQATSQDDAEEMSWWEKVWDFLFGWL